MVFNLPIDLAPENVELGLLRFSNYFPTIELVEISKFENQWNYTSLTSIDVYFFPLIDFSYKITLFLQSSSLEITNSDWNFIVYLLNESESDN